MKKLIVAVIALSIAGCKKEIQLDLNSKEEKIVIEAEFSASAKINTVKISKTLNFYDTNDFPQVSDAMVTIKNSLGYEEALTLGSPGNFYTKNFIGVPGSSYSLTVEHHGVLYSATSIMPQEVSLDSIIMSYDDESIGFLPLYVDIPGQLNYYRIVLYRNDLRIKNSYYFNDDFGDGEINLQPVYALSADYKSGDTVKLDLQSVDQATYAYFSSKAQTANLESAAPANPITNMSGGALGFFSVFGSQTKSVVIK
jgi:hypothetical protein